MALLTVTYLHAAVAIGAIQTLESAVLALRRGRGSMRNLYITVIELGFALMSAWEVATPASSVTRAVAIAYLSCFVLAIALGQVILRAARWKYTHGQPLPPFPLTMVMTNFVLVSLFFTYALYALLA